MSDFVRFFFLVCRSLSDLSTERTLEYVIDANLSELYSNKPTNNVRVAMRYKQQTKKKQMGKNPISHFRICRAHSNTHSHAITNSCEEDSINVLVFYLSSIYLILIVMGMIVTSKFFDCINFIRPKKDKWLIFCNKAELIIPRI